MIQLPAGVSWNMVISISFLCLTAIIVLAIAAHFQKDGSNFDIRQLVTDTVTGKLSPEKTAYMTALCVGTWGFVTMTLEGKMTEYYFVGYMTTFAAARLVSQGLSVYKDVNKDAKQ